MVTKSQYYAIKAGLSYTEKELINFYELQWHLRHRVPTVEEVVQYINEKHKKEGKDSKVSHTSVNYYLQRRAVVKALEQRGIPFRQHTQEDLTPTQVAAAVTVMNMMDTRDINEKLDQLGIAPATYYAWLNDPTFKNLVSNLSDQNLANIRPSAIAEFTKKVNQGDWNAIKYWLDATGELTNTNAPQSETLLKMIVEIIQDEVKDPDTIIRIANRIKMASANRTLEVVTTRPAITGEVVEDVELEQAKKKLGIE